MIHWAADPNEDSWVDEGCAEYAMLLFGVPDPLVSFPNNPNNDLTSWNNQFSDYIKTFMFMTYLSDHYGGSETIRSIVQQPQNSVTGVEMALIEMGYNQPFQSVFLDWTVANFYHGRGGADMPEPDSHYVYYSIDPPAFHISNHFNDHPNEGNISGVQKWAAKYIAFNSPDWIMIDVFNQNEMESGFGWFEYITPGNLDFVGASLGIDSQWDTRHDETNDYAAALLCGLGSYNTYNFGYVSTLINAVDQAPELANDFTLDKVYPNPFNQNTLIRFSSPANINANLEIYDIAGRLVRNRHIDGNQNTGEITWDGKNNYGEDVVSGIYLFKLSEGENSQIVKGTLLK
jgi:hypothetical protein